MDRSKGIGGTDKKHYNCGPDHWNWKGGKYISKVVYIRSPNHHRADCRGYVMEHILIAEKILGEPLPDKAVVHHVDGNPHNNEPSNLVICQDQGYHHYLHCRKRALNGCGDVHKRYCATCNTWKNIENFPFRKGKYHAGRCKQCDAKR